MKPRSGPRRRLFRGMTDDADYLRRRAGPGSGRDRCVPRADAGTVPPVSTVAIAELLLDQVIVAFGTTLLFASRPAR